MREAAVVAICLAALTGCARPNPLPSSASSAANDWPDTKVRDPSLALCARRGYRLVPMRQGGLVQSYLCINPETGLKCDSWAYYRGDCNLERSTPSGARQPPLSAP